MTATIEQIFFDWNSSCLEEAVSYIIEYYGTAAALDLSELTIALPSSRAGRRLLELLVEKAQQEGKVLVPPRIVTAGQLPELLYSPSGRVASDLERWFLWFELLRSADAVELKALIPVLPDASNISSLLQLAVQIDSLYVELSGASLCFEDVCQCLSEFYSGQSEDRWAVLSKLHAVYEELCAERGITDRYAERSLALENTSCAFNGTLLLISLVDLNCVTRRMIEQACGTVTVMIHAPEERIADFDELGSLRVDQWKAEILNIPRKWISIVDKPTDQGQAVCRALAEYSKSHKESTSALLPIEDVTIGVTDDELAGVVGGVCAGAAIETRVGAGISVVDTHEYQLIRLISEYLKSREYHLFAALMRHPLIEQYVTRQVDGFDSAQLLSVLDDYQIRVLPAKVTAQAGDSRSKQLLKSVCDALDLLFSPLRKECNSLPEAADNIRAFFVDLYAGRSFNRADSTERLSLEVNRCISDFLTQCDAIPDGELLSLSCTQILEVLAFVLKRAAVPLEQRPDAIEILGWLELHLDDAPFLVVAGCNEGALPESVSADPFLPDSLRSKLNLLDNDARLARDNYVLQSIIHSRARVRFIAGRRSAEGDPLIPGRPLLSVDEAALPERVTDLYAESFESGPQWPHIVTQEKEELLKDRWKPARIEEALRILPVTAFRDYRSCPYRFYLKYVLKLRRRQDDLLEMDARRFGTFAHDVLYDFGVSEQSSSCDAQEIQETLSLLLDKRFAREFGKWCMPAVIVQREQIRYRLAGFAEWQAQRNREGWTIKKCEFAPTSSSEETPVFIGKTGMQITARIDRIDYHEPSGTYQIFDYKTSEIGNDPEKMHRKNSEWIDFQLPAYRYILQQLGYEGELQPGYLVLPRKIEDFGTRLAEWDDAEYEEALREMEQIARAISAQEFWPPSEDLRWHDDYRSICDLALQQSERQQEGA